MAAQKTALITGANRGIGFEIARQLGKQDFHVLIGARNPEKGQAAAKKLQEQNITATFVELDVAEERSIQQAFGQVQNTIDQLDVLLNNAGILLSESDTLLTAPTEDIYRTMHINAFGALLVTRIFRPLLQKGSRVIMVSSGAGAITNGAGSYAPVYSLSKTAMNAITMHLSRDLKSSGISVNAVCPGWVRTDMGGAGAARSVEKGAETPVWLATAASAEWTGNFYRDKKQIDW